MPIDRSESAAAAEAVTFAIAKGNPSDEELGAVMAVLDAVIAAGAQVSEVDERPLAAGWRSHWRALRQPLLPVGRNAWQGSARP